MTDTRTVTLSRPKPAKAMISLVPMIDVMLILLVFFMVTSTYLNLDMIPAIATGDDTPPPTDASESNAGATMMIRLGSDGVPTIRGQPYSTPDLAHLIADRLSADPMLAVLVLPSAAADMQALISVMDSITHAGARNLRVVRLEALE
ncbi:ExbD/TolR family protein [Marivita sp. S0852]|uniref:ExbD/TolR family protein n=1 Tax=Marivita sp. S0852 TaxID=3373893 RepID=UPI0039828134